MSERSEGVISWNLVFFINYKYSNYLALSPHVKVAIKDKLQQISPVRVIILAYCIMPTHFHLILKQTEDGGISSYMAKVLDSYSKFFNIKNTAKLRYMN